MYFKTEAKFMIGLPILILSIALAVPVLRSMFVNSTVDSCLDAGGSFDYQSCQCDFKQSHKSKAEHSC